MASKEDLTFFPAVWNVLHDGEIVAISGSVPGTVALDIDINYLRRRFHDPGKIIKLTIIGCTHFAYRDFDDSKFITNLSAIEAFKPVIMGAVMRGEICAVDCLKGPLEVTATDGSLSLDNGRPVSLEELISVADAYWKEWSEPPEIDNQ
ncbi:MAG: hypothetical protein AB1599_07165 [Planctomycetota bacterium]